MTWILPAEAFGLLIYGALAAATVGAVGLLLLFISDVRKKSTW